MGTPFVWDTFEEWLTDFCELAPEDFSSEDYRLTYDSHAPEGCAPSTMRFAPSQKRRAAALKKASEAVQKTSPSPALSGVSELQRMLFTAELTLRLRSFKVDQTFEELVSEAAAAAGIDMLIS